MYCIHMYIVCIVNVLFCCILMICVLCGHALSMQCSRELYDGHGAVYTFINSVPLPPMNINATPVMGASALQQHPNSIHLPPPPPQQGVSQMPAIVPKPKGDTTMIHSFMCDDNIHGRNWGECHQSQACGPGHAVSVAFGMFMHVDAMHTRK